MRRLILVAAFILSLQASSFDQVEVYGDSLSAGFLAHTSVEQPPPLRSISQILSDMAKYFLSKDLAQLERHHRRDLAWPKLLATQLGRSIPVSNYAATMAKSEALYDQVSQHSRPSKASASFIFIGHNDLNKNTDPIEKLAEQFRSNASRAIEEWDKRHSESMLFFVPIGDIPQVYELLENVIWKSTQATYTCKDSWKKLFPYGRFFHQLQKEGRLNTYLLPRIQALNSVLESLALTWNRTKKNRFIYLPAVHRNPYRITHFAVDCFHLSPQGQLNLADAIYDGVLGF